MRRSMVSEFSTLDGGRGILPGSFRTSAFTLVDSEIVLPNVVTLAYTRAR